MKFPNPKYGKVLALMGGMYFYRHNASDWSDVHPAIRAGYAYGGFVAGAATGWLLAALARPVAQIGAFK